MSLAAQEAIVDEASKISRPLLESRDALDRYISLR
jgi:hypothetical protein